MRAYVQTHAMLFAGGAERLDFDLPSLPEWRNWQTRGTQNPERVTPRVGSIPTSGTIPSDPCPRYWFESWCHSSMRYAAVTGPCM